MADPSQLLSNTNSTLSISTTVFLLLLNPKVSWHDYRIVAEWLGAYTYILPAERVTLLGLPTKLFLLLAKRYGEQIASDYIFHIVRAVNNNLSRSHQEELINYITKELVA